MKILKHLPIIILLVVALFLRLYKIDNPVADWHSFRQADTASVTDRFVRNGINLFVPTYHDVSNIQSGKDNPMGYRMVELPLYNLLHYSVFKLVPSIGIDMAGRLTSVILSLASILFLYLIVSKLSGKFVGWLSAMFMSVLPFSVYYSRVILPEPLMIMSVLASFYFLIVGIEHKKIKKQLFLLLSAVLFSFALLTKPYAIFFALPHAAIIFRSFVNGQMHFLEVCLYSIISFVPLAMWRQHITKYAEGIPASDWLLNAKGIRFRPAWFRWLFGERLGKLILGIYGTCFFMLGLVAKPKNEGLTLWLWVIGIITYFSVIAGGNVQHDYYQSIIIPFVCAVLGKGAALVLSLSRSTYSRSLTILTFILTLSAMIGLSWYDIQGWYQINNPSIIEAGKALDKIAPADAKVIAPYNGDTAFLYQTHRQGWPIGFYIEGKIIKGASYYVSVNFDDEANELMKKYTIVEKTEKYVIIKLTK